MSWKRRLDHRLQPAVEYECRSPGRTRRAGHHIPESRSTHFLRLFPGVGVAGERRRHRRDFCALTTHRPADAQPTHPHSGALTPGRTDERPAPRLASAFSIRQSALPRVRGGNPRHRAEPVRDWHPYLRAEGVGPHDVRVWVPVDGDKQDHSASLAPRSWSVARTARRAPICAR